MKIRMKRNHHFKPFDEIKLQGKKWIVLEVDGRELLLTEATEEAKDILEKVAEVGRKLRIKVNAMRN